MMQQSPKSIAFKILHTCLLGYAVILGLLAATGAIQAYYYELDEWLNPHFYNTPAEGPAQHPASLIETFEAEVPQARVWYMEQRKAPGRSVMFAVEPRPDAVTGEPADLPYNYYYMDPVTAEIVGARNWGACCFEPENLMNFTYELHRTLMLPGLWGLYITGAVAVIWLLASLGFVGYAAASSRFPNARKIPFIAVGVLMIPLAVSNVAMNLNDELFRPVVNWFSPIKPTIYGEYAAMESPDYGERKLTYRDAFDQATAFGREKGWSNPPGEFFYSAIYNFYGVGYGLRDPHNMGNDWIFISADNGAVLRERTPRSGTAGEVFAAAQLPIHSGRVLGGLSQFYVFVMGLLITFLCWRLGRFAVRGLSNS